MISVITTTYNSERTVRVLLESLAASRYADFEVCLCDDASADGTLAAVRAYSDRLNLRIVVAETNGGPALARNSALALARGDLHLFLDSDVRLYPDTIDRLLASMERTGADVLEGCYSPVAVDGGMFSRYYALFAHHSFLVTKGPYDYNVFNAWCALCRPEVMQRTGGHGRVARGVEIENEELGRRIVAQGFSLMLDPTIAVDHRWGGHGKLVFIFTSRVYWWVKTFFATGFRFEKALTTASYGLATLCGPLALLAAAAGWVLHPVGYLACAFGLAAFAAGYASFYAFVLRRVGISFCALSVALSLYFSVYVAASAVFSALEEVFLRVTRGRYTLDPSVFGTPR